MIENSKLEIKKTAKLDVGTLTDDTQLNTRSLWVLIVSHDDQHGSMTGRQIWFDFNGFYKDNLSICHFTWVWVFAGASDAVLQIRSWI